MDSRERRWLDPMVPLRRHVAVGVVAVLVYLVVNRAVVVLQFWPGTASLYLPAGISVALLVGLGPGHALTVFVAMMATTFGPDRSFLGWMRVTGYAAGVTATYATTAWLLHRARFDPAFRRFSDALRFTASFLVASLVAAVLVTAVRSWGIDVAPLAAAARATAFWIGDAAAILTVAPFLLLWLLPAIRGEAGVVERRVEVGGLEIAAQMASILVVIAAIAPIVAGRVDEPVLFLLFLPMVWIASRSGLRFTTAASTVLIVGAAAALATGSTGARPQLLVASVLVVLSGTGLLLGALIEERNRTLARLRERERNLARAEAVARLGCWSWDPRAGTCSWSDELHNLHGRPRDRDVGPTTYLDYVVESDRKLVRAEVERALDERGQFSVEYTLVTEEGRRRRIHLQGGVEEDEHGEVVGVTGTCQDITESRLAEEEALRTRRMKLLGRLAADVAHDFNNYLTVIHGRASLLTDELDGDAAEDLAEIRQTVDSARTLNRQLLAFARGASFEPEIVDLAREIEGHEWIFQRLIGDGAELVLELDEGLPAVVVERVRFEQVVNNLVVNAREALPDDGGTITLRSRAVGPDVRVVLDVIDDGTGMDPDTLDRIFDPFFTTKSDQGGTGLGLAMVERIVRDWGGEIRVESAPGRGTTFSVILPPAP